MAKAEIIEDLGAGQYTIKRIWAGRAEVQAKIDAYNAEIAKLQEQYDTMPVTTDDELFAKHVVGLQIKVFEKKVIYFTNNFPEDETVDAWCVDYTEGLTGEVGTIDIAGEKTTDVNIRPNGIASNAYSGARDGELYPGIALGPWTSLLNLMIYPGWQRFKPLHRYAWVLEDTIDYTANTCAVAIQPTFSLMNYNVNKAATGGGEEPAAAANAKSKKITNFNVNLKHGMSFEEITLLRKGVLETKAASRFYVQNSAMTHPGFLDFVDRNPDHPISNVAQLNSPIYITDEQYIQIQRICSFFDYLYRYKSDQSGYNISDYWDVMYDIGDPWYWYQSYRDEPQSEFTFGNVNLISDYRFGYRPSDATIEEYYLYGTYTERNITLEFEANQRHFLGPDPKRTGDCEDFVLTKMQAIIEAGIIPKENLQILLCYVLNAGYHAVLGIQTANRGFLISDQRDYGQLWEIEQLSSTHFWESFSVATAAGEASETVKWAKSQFIIKDVPFEYMDCDSDAFTGLDEVVVEFTDQDWDQPKVIGFKEEPRICSGVYVFPGENAFGSGWFEEESRTFKLSYFSESWAWKNPFPRDYSYPGEDNVARVSYAATGENGLGFTVGGRTVSDTTSAYYYFDHLDIFDSVAESFSIGENYPIDIMDLTFNSLKNGKCIAHGGRSYWGHTGNNETYKYTIASDSWNWPASGVKCFDHASFLIDSIVYVVGGNTGDGGNAVYYGSDNYGYGVQDYYNDYSGGWIPNKTVRAYDDDEQTWSLKTDCPVDTYVQVRGWSLDGKGLVGGGAYTYEHEWYVYPGTETMWSCPSGNLYWDLSDALEECGSFEYKKESIHVHDVYLDIGLQRDRSTHLYDNLTDSWTTKSDNLFSAVGNQATSTAQDETVALAFSLQNPGYTDNWYDYKLSTDAWSDRGEFGLYSYEDEDAGIQARFNRFDAAGAEI